MGDRDRRIFLLAGASAGVGALFTAPLGGALFAPEVLYKKAEFEGDAIIPCIISSIVAYTVFRTVTGESRAIHLDKDVLESLSWGDPRQLGLYLVLALACALVGWLYVHIFDGVHTLFEKLRAPSPLKAAAGGLLLGALALAITPWAEGNGIFFGGYDLIQGSIEGRIGTVALLVLILAKILATSFSISSGGSGGVFAPSLAIGAMLGALMGSMGAAAFPGLGVNPSSFALVGMGAFFTGVSKTPIAAILMVSEMTGGYELLAPLMLVSVANMLMSTRWTMYKSQVPGLVDSPAHSGDFVVDVLEGMRVEALLDEARKPTLVSERATLRQALEIVGNAAGTYFPVVDENQRMVGIFSLSDVRRIYGVSNIEDLVIVRDFMVERVETVTPEDGLDAALKILNERSIHELPIVDSEDAGLVLGMMTRNVLGVAYQKRLRALRLRKGLDTE
jgi:CIC family chloride channel protein